MKINARNSKRNSFLPLSPEKKFFEKTSGKIRYFHQTTTIVSSTIVPPQNCDFNPENTRKSFSVESRFHCFNSGYAIFLFLSSTLNKSTLTLTLHRANAHFLVRIISKKEFKAWQKSLKLKFRGREHEMKNLPWCRCEKMNWKPTPTRKETLKMKWNFQCPFHEWITSCESIASERSWKNQMIESFSLENETLERVWWKLSCWVEFLSEKLKLFKLSNISLKRFTFFTLFPPLYHLLNLLWNLFDFYALFMCLPQCFMLVHFRARQTNDVKKGDENLNLATWQKSLVMIFCRSPSSLWV